MALTVSFNGKRVLVTGGGKGIGYNIVEKLYNDGAIVYTVDKEESLVAKLKQDFPNINAVVLDLGDWATTKNIVESFGPLDHLVNNAAIAGFGQHFLNITETAIDTTLAVNYKSIINVTQTVAKGMIAEKIQGSIVNVASVTGTYALETAAVSCSTKAALVMLTKSMALELGETHKIRVNCVSPTFVNTDVMKGNPVLANTYIQRGVFKRAAETEEVTDTILFLLSSKASMITGEQVFIDGGLSCH